jgi:hypothetical protein
MRGLRLGLVLLLALGTGLSFGKTRPPGISDEEAAWWECQKNAEGMSCCGQADGHVLQASEWRETKKGYEVFLRGNWYPVPPKAVIRAQCGTEPDPEKRWLAKVWYAPSIGLGGQYVEVVIYCFLPVYGL